MKLLTTTFLMCALTASPAVCQAPLAEEQAKIQRATKEEFRKQWCQLARAAGLPIRIDPKLRQEMDLDIGAQRSREILLPVARVNNAWGCFCTSGETRLNYRCR